MKRMSLCCGRLAASALRRYSQLAQVPSQMDAWQVSQFEGPLVCNRAAVPPILRPTEMLVEVKAASLNPVDTRMRDGYGRELLGLWHWADAGFAPQTSRLPMTLGRDCSGVVRQVGPSVRKFGVGDEVFAAVGAQRQGSLAEFVVVDEAWSARKPAALDHAGAAAVPYAALTAHVALVRVGRLGAARSDGQRVLVHGGAGGVGTAAVQLLRAWGADVVATCAADAADLVRRLGATPVDYASGDAFEQLLQLGPYDLILDPIDSDVSRRSAQLLGVWRRCVFVSLVSPLLGNTDEHGAVVGLGRSAFEWLAQASQGVCAGRFHAWSYFMPDGAALEEVAGLIDEGKMNPVVERVVAFDQVPSAFEIVAQRHGRGKTVIAVDSSCQRSPAEN